MKKKYLLPIAFLGMTFLWQGCLKNNNENIIYYDFQTVTENFMLAYLIHSETYFRLDSVFRSLNDSLALYPSGSYNWGKATMTVTPPDTVTYPKVFVLDYGSDRALDSLTGRITGNITKKYLETGSEINYTFVDFKVDSFDVKGFDTLRVQQNQGDVVNMTFMVRDGLIIRPLQDGSHDTITFECIEYPDYSFNVMQFSINEGYAAGLSTDSLHFAVDVDPNYPLIRHLGCPFISDGILNYHIRDYHSKSIGEGIIHFGFPAQGECDKYALIVVNGDGYQVQMEFIMD